MKIDESSLTGESLAASRKPGDTVLAGAVVAEGELDAVVTATGRECFFGKTMALLDAPQQTGHLQKVSGHSQPWLSMFCLWDDVDQHVCKSKTYQRWLVGCTKSLSECIYMSLFGV